jgi:glycolate oxidase FAD binding subunit
LVVASGARLHVSHPIEQPFLVLCTDRLNGMETYEPADLTLTAGAGTPMGTLATQLHANRQWLPFDPPYADERFLGGLVATGESGPLWMGYGELRNHVLGLTLVTGDGRTLHLGGRVVKNVAGFDLLKAVVGSRGRLGVITSVCVRAFPEPARERLLVLHAEAAKALVPAARAIGTAPIMPVSSVIVAGVGGVPGARLLVRLHGAEATVEADRKTLERHCGVTFETSLDPTRMLVAARDHVTTGELVVRLSVLPSRLPDAFAAVHDLLGERALVADTYRASVRMAAAQDDGKGIGRLRARVEALGGALAISAARGVDVRSLASGVPAPAASLTKSLEQVFDPKGVLWPNRL